MSLDVYLKNQTKFTTKGTGIFVRRHGSTVELSLEEAKELYPDITIEEQEFGTDDLFRYNITHNLAEMADKAGIYKELWRPEEIGITEAHQLIVPLRNGLNKLKSDRKWFETFNPDNGWGNYDLLVQFVFSYLEACCSFPDAKVEVSR